MVDFFKLSDDDEETNFVESNHIHNLANETVDVLNKAKLPLVPVLYQKTFFEILEKLPEDTQQKINSMQQEYIRKSDDLEAEDLLYHFHNFSLLLKNVVDIYNKVNSLQRNLSKSQEHYKSIAKVEDFKKILQLFTNSTDGAISGIGGSLTQLKKNYLQIQTYIKSIHDLKVYDKVYTSVFNKEFFFQTLAADLNLLSNQSATGLGIFAVKLANSVASSLKTTANTMLKDSQKNIDIQIQMINEGICRCLQQLLRKIDYIGCNGNIFLVCFQQSTHKLFESFLENVIFYVTKSHLFTQEDIIKINVGALFVDTEGEELEAIQKFLSTVLKDATSSEEPFILRTMQDSLV